MPKTSKPTLNQAITGPIEKRLRNAAMALPGVVKKFNGTTVDVQPGVHRTIPSSEDPDLDELEEMPVIPNVPIVWVQSVGIKVRGTLRVGDPVLIIAMDRDISGWRKSGKASAPNDARSHHWGNCIAIPGLIPNSDPFPEPSDAAALASLVKDELDKVKADMQRLITWVTSGTNSGGPVAFVPPTGPTLGPHTPASVASTILKLDN